MARSYARGEAPRKTEPCLVGYRPEERRAAIEAELAPLEVECLCAKHRGRNLAFSAGPDEPGFVILWRRVPVVRQFFADLSDAHVAAAELLPTAARCRLSTETSAARTSASTSNRSEHTGKRSTAARSETRSRREGGMAGPSAARGKGLRGK